MSSSKPLKVQKVSAESQVKRGQPASAMSHPRLTPVAVKDRPTTTPLPEYAMDPTLSPSQTPSLSQREAMMTSDSQPRHPKGHKVRSLADVWKSMDNQSYWRLTDSLTLMDVWSQPISVEKSELSTVGIVTFIQLVDAPKLKSREVKTKCSLGDLLKICYLNECLTWDIRGEPHVEYDDWIAEKTANFVTKYGVGEVNNMVKLCNFIIAEDPTFSFYPQFFKCNVGVFFRKTCYHSYQAPGLTEKIPNMMMIKCAASRGAFEYMIEAKFIVLPADFFHTSSEAEIPETQPLC